MNTWTKMSALGAAAVVAGCASAPKAPPVTVTVEQKLAWIHQLEDRRVLSVDLPAPPAPAPVKQRRGKASPPPPATADLAALVSDPQPRVRRRAALAAGRAGLPEGARLLLPLLADADADVRRMAAFALGLIGVALDGTPQPHASLVPAVAALTKALADPDPLVRGRAAEALGQIGARDAAPAIGAVVSAFARTPAVTAMRPDDEQWPSSPEADAFRLGLFALARLRAYDQIAAAVLDGSGRPAIAWWPVAYALQRAGDARAVPALRELLKTPGRYTAAFAARGLGELKDGGAADALAALIDPATHPLEVVVAATRAAAVIGAADAIAPLSRAVTAPNVDPNIRLEAVEALGTLRARDALPAVQDLLTDPWAALRAAALRAAAAIDGDGFLFLLSGLDPDPHWRVRAGLAGVLGTLPPEVGLERLRMMLDDQDKRVVPSVLRALVRLQAPDIDQILLAKLTDADPVVRETAAEQIGQRQVAGAVEALRGAYTTGQKDASYGARAAALVALAGFGGADAVETLKSALTDREWAVRVRAAQLLAKIDPTGAHALAIRPATGTPPAPYDDPLLIVPPTSPHAFIDTAKGTIEIELAVLDAPQTARNFAALAARGFFDGVAIHRVVPNFVVQDGDPRGDGEGGPGYSIRDELNDRPYVRGTVGMALSWRDTGGSQFFITHSPQPHLEGRYTVFGHVVSGMDVVDRIQQGDVIQQIRIVNGKPVS